MNITNVLVEINNDQQKTFIIHSTKDGSDSKEAIETIKLISDTIRIK